MNDFSLNKDQLAVLRRAHRRARSKRDADKLKAVYLLGSGWTVASVCEALLLDENTVYRYQQTYSDGGIVALLKENYKGSESKLMDSELKELADYLVAHPCRTTKQVIDYVEREYEVTYSISGMNALLKRLGFVFKKPRAVPGKSNKEAQQKFIKEYRSIRENMGDDDSLFFMDGVHPQHNPIVQYGWFKKGEKQPLKTNTRYHRLNIPKAI